MNTFVDTKHGLNMVMMVKWEYEDDLPDDLSDAVYDMMLPMSRVDGVRLFPYLEFNGSKVYLGSVE